MSLIDNFKPFDDTKYYGTKLIPPIIQMGESYENINTELNNIYKSKSSNLSNDQLIDNVKIYPKKNISSKNISNINSAKTDFKLNSTISGGFNFESFLSWRFILIIIIIIILLYFYINGFPKLDFPKFNIFSAPNIINRKFINLNHNRHLI